MKLPESKERPTMPDPVAHVICLNDFPAGVFIGSIAEAAEEMEYRRGEYLRASPHPGHPRALFWHIKTVPLLRGYVEPATPGPAGVLLSLWSKQLRGDSPNVEHIAGKLHQLADSLLSEDEPC